MTNEEAEFIAKVVGHKRFVENFHKPVSEWPLTPRMIALIKAGPHGVVPWNEDWEDYLYAGVTLTRYRLRCNCGAVFVTDLPSQAHAAHNLHNGDVFVAAADRKIGAEAISA